jgi:hypothetical protein
MEETKAIDSAVEKAWEVPTTSVMSIKGMEVQGKPLVANQKRKSQESMHGNPLMMKKKTVMEVSRS